MRFSGRDGNLHRAAHPPFASNRDDDGAKRGGPFEADFGDGGHHQQFFVAAFRTIQHANRRYRNDCRDSDAGSRFEPKHSTILGSKWSRLQRELLRNLERGDDAISKRKFRRRFGDVHGAKRGSGSEHGYRDRNAASGPVENCPSDIRNSVWSRRKRLALNGDAGGESSRGAERTGE